MSESATNNQAVLRKATPAGATVVIVAQADMPSRETLLQWREGLILQLRAIERILGLDTKSLEVQGRKR